MSKLSFYKKDGVKISYRYYKRSKKTLIFLHGLLSDMSGKKSNFLNNYCKKNKISYLCFDFQGHGRSSGEFTNFGISDWYDDLDNIVKYLKIRNFILIGSSMGGWVAIIYALMHPKKVTKLIGIDPSKELNAMAKKIANKNDIDVEFIESSAEVIPLPDKSVDTVLVTYTMCTVPDVMSANIEMKRVLKNDGEMLFCEHGIAAVSYTHLTLPTKA